VNSQKKATGFEKKNLHHICELLLRVESKLRWFILFWQFSTLL